MIGIKTRNAFGLFVGFSCLCCLNKAELFMKYCNYLAILWFHCIHISLSCSSEQFCPFFWETKTNKQTKEYNTLHWTPNGAVAVPVEQEENGYLSEQFISGRRPSPLDSRRSDMTDQDKWSGSEVRSIQSSDCPRQEQRGQTVNKAQLPPILTQRQFGLWVAQGSGKKKKKSGRRTRQIVGVKWAWLPPG